jgi:hypothetical protein
MFFRFFGRLQLILTEVGVLYPFFICCLSDCQQGIAPNQVIRRAFHVPLGLSEATTLYCYSLSLDILPLVLLIISSSP